MILVGSRPCQLKTSLSLELGWFFSIFQHQMGLGIAASNAIADIKLASPSGSGSLSVSQMCQAWLGNCSRMSAKCRNRRAIAPSGKSYRLATVLTLVFSYSRMRYLPQLATQCERSWKKFGHPWSRTCAGWFSAGRYFFWQKLSKTIGGKSQPSEWLVRDGQI